MPTSTANAAPSTRPLSEVARHLVIPAGIVDSLWFDLEPLFAEWGDEFDRWQDGLGQLILGLREDGMFAATVGGVVISIPRQVAKTFIVGRIVFAIAAKFPNLTVLWTAHRVRTATQTFEKLKGLARRPAVRAHMLDNASGGIRSVNGEQEFQFRNGSRIMFGAREQGFGRGFDEVDVEVFDEAQILTEKALEDMVAATNQSRFPHGALLFFMGTPPRPADPGDEFRNRRSEALALKPDDQVQCIGDDMLYVECAADPATGLPNGPAIDDLEQIAKANPSYPHRTPLISIRRLWKNLTSDDSKRREGLGIWDVESGPGVFTAGAWPRCASEKQPGKPAALGIASDVDQVWLSLGAATSEDFPHVGAVLRVRANDKRDEFVSEVRRIQREHDIPVAIDAKGPAGVLIPDLEAAGVRLTILGLEDNVQACSGMVRTVDAGGLRHGDYPDLNAAVDSVGWRKVGDRRVFARRSGEISMLEAVAFALWASKNPAAVPAEPSAYFV